MSKVREVEDTHSDTSFWLDVSLCVGQYDGKGRGNDEIITPSAFKSDIGKKKVTLVEMSKCPVYTD